MVAFRLTSVAAEYRFGAAHFARRQGRFFRSHQGAQTWKPSRRAFLIPKFLPHRVRVFPLKTFVLLFPALTRPPGFIFFDNAAGAQVPQAVLDAVNHHLVECNVQRGGRYAKSQEVDATILRARHSVADLVNARDASEIAFGMNATSFIRLVSLAIGQTLDKRNEIVVTEYGPRGQRSHLAGAGTERSKNRLVENKGRWKSAR
jgi:hypothetical protein